MKALERDRRIDVKRPLDRAGLFLGEFIGYRIWEVHDVENVPTLRSWVYPCFWPPGGYISDISHEVPGYAPTQGVDDYNDRGVWAFKTPEALEAEFSSYIVRNSVIYGSCFMWGTIIECEKGYRAQYARPRSLDWCVDTTVNLEFMRKRYFLD